MIWSVILTIGVIATVEAVLVVLHAVNPAHHGPAGGESNFRGATETLALLGTLTAILIGATAGSQDVANGVFRDLVVTGRKRSTLFNVRIPGALIVLLPMVLIAFAVAVAFGFLSAGDLPNPSASRRFMSWSTCLAYSPGEPGNGDRVCRVCQCSHRDRRADRVEHRGPHILISFHSFGGARKLIDVAAIEHFQVRNSSGQRRHVHGRRDHVLAAWAASSRARAVLDGAPRRLNDVPLGLAEVRLAHLLVRLQGFCVVREHDRPVSST